MVSSCGQYQFASAGQTVGRHLLPGVIKLELSVKLFLFYFILLNTVFNKIIVMNTLNMYERVVLLFASDEYRSTICRFSCAAS